MECLMSYLATFLKRNIQTAVLYNHTFTYKYIAPADNFVQLEFNFSSYGDYYIDLNSVLLS
jgi:hypothetical protein